MRHRDGTGFLQFQTVLGPCHAEKTDYHVYFPTYTPSGSQPPVCVNIPADPKKYTFQSCISIDKCNNTTVVHYIETVRNLKFGIDNRNLERGLQN